MSFSDFFDTAIAQRALLACVLIGFTNGFVSGFVLLRSTALKVGTISHSLLPGIALSVLITGGLSDWSTLAGAIFAAMIVGLGSLMISRTSRIKEDAAMAILYTTAFAIGLLILNRLSLRAKLDEWIFGSIVGMSDSDLWVAFFVSLGSVTLLTALQRPILIWLFEENIAESLGVPVRFLNYALFSVVILVLISSLQAVGCILSVGLLIAPAATIYLFSDNARHLFWGGGLLGAGGSVAAFFLSYPLNLHISSSIILVLGVIFALAYIFSPRYGLLTQWLKKA